MTLGSHSRKSSDNKGMGLFLFKRSSSKKAATSSVASPGKQTDRSVEDKPEKSQTPQSRDPQTGRTRSEVLSQNLPQNLLVPQQADSPAHPQKKRISTVVDDSHFDDFEKDDYENHSAEERYSDETESSEDEDYEEHTHISFERDRSHSISHLSALMGYCGLGQSENKESLKKLANEVSKRTFSLLASGLKINRLSPTMRSTDPHFHDSVIGEYQLKLLNSLKTSIDKFLDTTAKGKSPYDLLKNNKTLYDRYGSVKDIIGRGAYGVIRIVDSAEKQGNLTRSRTFAVKELKKRPSTSTKAQETKEQFIDRVISEFILSSTLNNKHVVRTLDLMITLPERSRIGNCNLYEEVRVSQVMDCTSGGDLFHYCKKSITNHEYLSIDEIDCMVKQITKGLWYIHSHGVAHCDLKLENILLEYDPNFIRMVDGKKRCRVNLKISDFGKSSVIRTQWDTSEQLSTSGVAIGSEPYMAPEEHTHSHSHQGISLLKKDCWALGVIVLVLFNIRRSFFFKSNGTQCQLEFYNTKEDETDTRTYGAAYLWQTTEAKSLKLGTYKDPVFAEYVKTAMIAHYDSKSKEWSMQKRGKFIPIETMFDIPTHFKDPGYDDDLEAFEKDDFDLRKFCTYKLLDLNPKKRLDAGAFLKSDWLAPVECCGD